MVQAKGRIISPTSSRIPFPVQVEAQGPVPETVAFHGISLRTITPGKLNTDAASWMITVDDFVNDFCEMKTNPFTAVSETRSDGAC